MKIGNQMVYFKDSSNMDEVEDESIPFIVTSPPYWKARDYGSKNQIGYGQSYPEYIDSLNKVWKECVRVLQPNGKIAIVIQPLPIATKLTKSGRREEYNIMWDVEAFMRKNDLFLSCMFCWDKTVSTNTAAFGSYPKTTNIHSNLSFEQIYVWVKHGKTRECDRELMAKSVLKKSEWKYWTMRWNWDDISPVIKFGAKGKNRFGHSAPFPEAIPYRLIRMHTIEGETVLDPFLGSGTTLKVARGIKRKGIGYEINPDYKNLIKKRIMEPFEMPHPPQKQYKSIGNETFHDIILAAVDELASTRRINREGMVASIVESLGNRFPKIMTKAFVKNVITHGKIEKKRRVDLRKVMG